MCVLRSEKMVCQSLTEDDQLYVCRGISKGGGNRPGDGQPGFLSKIGMTISKASHAVWEDGRYFCVCIYVARTCHIHIYTRAFCMHLSNSTTHTHTLTHKNAHTKHALIHAQNHICHGQWLQDVDCPLKAAQTNTAREGDRERAKARIEPIDT